MKNLTLFIVLSLLIWSCSNPNAYIVREYIKLPEGLSKNAYIKIVKDKNAFLNSESGYVKIYDLVRVEKGIQRNFPFEHFGLLKYLYAQRKDSSLIYSNILKLGSLKRRYRLWYILPSVYPEVYKNNKTNPNLWIPGLDHEIQRAYRDSVDKYLSPILNVSKYKLDINNYFTEYRFAMRVKRANKKVSGNK